MSPSRSLPGVLGEDPRSAVHSLRMALGPTKEGYPSPATSGSCDQESCQIGSLQLPPSVTHIPSEDAKSSLQLQLDAVQIIQVRVWVSVRLNRRPCEESLALLSAQDIFFDGGTKKVSHQVSRVIQK